MVLRYGVVRALLGLSVLLIGVDALAVSAPVDGAIATLNPDNPPEGRFLDEWMEVYMGGGKVGYIHTTFTREHGVIHTLADTKMRLGRVDSPVEIKMTQFTTETLEGVPVRFGSKMDASVMQTSTTGKVHDGKVEITTAQYGMEQTQTFDFPKGALMTWGLFRESLRRGFKPGTKYTLSTYTPELRMDDAIEATTLIGDWESFEHAGKQLRGQRVTMTMNTPAGALEMVSWVDAASKPIKAQLPMPGLGNMVMIRSNQASAMADFLPPEIFMKTVVKASRSLKRETLAEVTYRIKALDAKVDLSEIPSAASQRVIEQNDDSVLLKITRQKHEAIDPGKADDESGSDKPLDKDGLKEFLASNLMINTGDPELIALAKKVAGDEKDPYRLGDKLRRFVTKYVKTKSLNIGFATASEVCRNREGDCSEHGVLLAALGRLNGLPARVAVGLVYIPIFGGQKDIFGYHLWTQFYIDGRWVDFDAALRESVCSPIRIAFATSSLKNSGLADLSLPLLTKIGSIDIDIVSVKQNPSSGD